jgi:heme/copper-type cytochrome/quinol oxidase subunit 2
MCFYTLRLILILFAYSLAVQGAPATSTQTSPNQSDWSKETIFALISVVVALITAFLAVMTIFIMVFFASPSTRNWITRKETSYKAIHSK